MKERFSKTAMDVASFIVDVSLAFFHFGAPTFSSFPGCLNTKVLGVRMSQSREGFLEYVQYCPRNKARGLPHYLPFAKVAEET